MSKRMLSRLSLVILFASSLHAYGAAPPVRARGEDDDSIPARLSAKPENAAAAEARGSELFSKLVERNDERARLLERYSGTREYELRNDKDQLSAREVVRVEFRAPDSKSFQTVSEEGSKWIRRFVFKGLIASETEAASGREHRDSSITQLNYSFRYLGQENLDGRPCYVVYATPKRVDKYLFEGTVWIDSQDVAVAKIDGHPAKSPSFWIRRVDWVRRYGKVGDFWLPQKDVTFTDVRIFGRKKLVINYQGYVVNSGQAVRRKVETNPRSLAETSGH
ncbi:MAG: hypothetical protein ACM3NO_07580 [Deltaproteobacteria bacterium]